MAHEMTIGRRLVTQNLIVSAAYSEIAPTPTWASVRDFAALVDAFCLYDTIEVLGREVNDILDQRSNIGSALLQSGALRIHSPSDYSDIAAESAKRHLLSYLAAEDFGGFDNIVRFAISPATAKYSITNIPDSSSEVQQGDLWLRTTPRREDLLTQLERESSSTRGTTFLIRSFLYLGYADAVGVAYVPDAARSGLLSHVANKERDLRNQLLLKISDETQHTMWFDEALFGRTSPLAAVVLERSGNRGRLATELAALREELAPMRARLNNIEYHALYGKGTEVKDAMNKWKLIMAELARTYGETSHLVSRRQLISFADASGDLADNHMKSTNWISFLRNLPFDAVARMLSRKPVLELHHLSEEVPGSKRLGTLFRKVFGDPV